MASDVGFLAIWAMLEAAFGAQERARYNLYRQRFDAHEDVAVKNAAMKCVDECRAFPTVADILARLPGTVTSAMSAEAAWSRCLRSIDSGPWSDGGGITHSMPTGTDLDQITLDAIGGPRGLYRLSNAIEFDPSKVSYIKTDFSKRYSAITGLGNAGLLPTGETIHHDELMGVDDIDDDHLLEEHYDA